MHFRHVSFSDNAQDSSPKHKRTTLRGSPRTEKPTSTPTFVLLTLKILIGLIFFIIVLVSSVLSKLTLVSLTDALRHHTWLYQNGTKPTDDEQNKWRIKHRSNVISLYWQLLLVLLVPSCFTFLRCLFFGFLGKTMKSYPWPKGSAVLLVC